MYAHQRNAFQASRSTSSLPESGLPPVPSFPDHSLDFFSGQPQMAPPGNMHGSSSSRSPLSLSILTDIDLDNSGVWDHPSASGHPSDMFAFMTEQALGDSLLRHNSSSSNETPNTVSPYQVELSTPASARELCDLTPATTFYSNSPSMLRSADVSPMFAIQDSPAMNDNYDIDQTDYGLAMFGSYDDIPEAPMAKLSLKQTAAMTRAKSSAAKSPRSPLSKVANSGVRKSTKPRTKDLKDICPDPNDAKACKTARNTLAARKSRARKANRVDTMEEDNATYQQQIEELEAQVELWKQRASDRGWRAGAE
ncbi:MAG: hypothetical protein Q9168_002340 [Polycauliona sp. 1 TL-2023]